MLLTVKCACGKWLDVDDAQLGKAAQCPWCGTRFTAGDAVRSSTALQAEEPPPEPMKRETPPPLTASQETPTISITRPWLVPPALWFLIFGLLAACALAVLSPCMIGSVGDGASQAELAVVQVRGPLITACQAYETKHGKFPQKLDDLLEKDAVGGPYLESPDALIDPWGQRYRYDVKGPRNQGVKPDIWTVTPDGREIGNWPRGG